jgi:hypothetical protein
MKWVPSSNLKSNINSLEIDLVKTNMQNEGVLRVWTIHKANKNYILDIIY